MLYLQRSVQTDKLVGNETVIRFKFTDINEFPDWWLIARENEVDVCVKDPGKEVDIYFTCLVKTMIDVWMGDISYRKAVSRGELKVIGHRALTNDIFTWINPSIFGDLPLAKEIQ